MTPTRRASVLVHAVGAWIGLVAGSGCSTCTRGLDAYCDGACPDKYDDIALSETEFADGTVVEHVSFECGPSVADHLAVLRIFADGGERTTYFAKVWLDLVGVRDVGTGGLCDVVEYGNVPESCADRCYYTRECTGECQVEFPMCEIGRRGATGSP